MSTTAAYSEVRACPRCGLARTVQMGRPNDLCMTCKHTKRPATEAPDWTDAACAGHDTELWYPTGNGRRQPADWDTPRLLCASCPIRHACAEWALSDPDPTHGEGVWGGLTPRDRARLKNGSAA